MPASPQLPGRDLTPATRAAVFAGFFALAALIHAAMGAYASGFGSFEDEPAHLVTALMIRDFLASGDYGDPRGFAETFYIHYPKVAVGQWPPVFHGMLGVWMLLAGTSTISVALFLSLVTAATAFAVHSVVRRPLGEPAGLLAGALLLVVPVFMACSCAAMTEVLIALLGLLAVLAFGSFLDSGKARWAFAFAGLSVLTILTKGSGLALGLVPPLAIVIGRRLDVLWRPALWGAGLLVALVTGPWYFATLGFTQGTWDGGAEPSLVYTETAARFFAGWLPGLTGWLGLVLLPVGYAWAVRSAELRGRWSALAAWVPAVLALHLVIPSSAEERHLAVLAPAWVIFSAVGAGVAMRWILRTRPAGGQAAAAVGIVALILAQLMTAGQLPTKHWSGWGDAASEMVRRGDQVPARMLIASDPTGEGLFVAGLALAEPSRPGRVALRASKVLGNAGWTGKDYAVRFPGPPEVDAYLRSTGVGLVFLDESVRPTRHWYGHMQQLAELTGDPSLGWELLGRWDVIRDGRVLSGALSAYVLPGWRGLPAPPIALDDVLRR